MTRKPSQTRRPPSAAVPYEGLEAFLDRVAQEPLLRGDEVCGADARLVDGRVFAPAEALARCCLELVIPAALTRRVRAGEPVVVVIEVASATWVDPLAGAVSRIFGGVDVLKASKPATSSSAPKTEQRVIRRPLFAVASERAFLPRAVVAGADVVIQARISAKAVSRTFRSLYRRSVRVEARDVAGLDFDDVVFSLRPGSTPAACLARMRRAAASVMSAADDVPSLHELAAGGEALRELKAIAADLMAVRNGDLAGGALPSVLLWGDPGCGKTTMARALAKSVGLPFVSCSVGDWFSGAHAHLGTVIAGIRTFFDQAVAASPCVALIDELDAVPDRAQLDDRARDWWTPVVTTLLTAIDRARAKGSGILLVGATNHLSRLDGALTRAGRFDRHMEVRGLRDAADVTEVLRHALGSDLAGADLSALGLIGARKKVSIAAAREWVRGARERARQRDAKLAIEDLIAMVSPQDRRTPEMRRLIALHEAGHAVVARILGFSVAAVTILSHGDSDGVASLIFEEGAATRADLERRVQVALAGRAADEVLGAGASASAAGDLQHATRVLTVVHGGLGLGDRLTARPPTELGPYDFELQRTIELELQRLMEETRTLVRLHEQAICALAEVLLETAVAVEADVDRALAIGASARGRDL